MPDFGSVVFADTNSIIEAHRVNAWTALTARYRVETVEKCFEETQTGFQNRRPEQNIDPAALRASLGAIHPVSELELATVLLMEQGAFLHDGEQALWAHALTRKDAWILCGPDTASMQFGFKHGRRDRLRCLGGLLMDIGHPSTRDLRRNYRAEWLSDLTHRMVMGLL